MPEIHYRTVMDPSEVDGYTGLTCEGRNVFVKIFKTARSVRATEEGSLVVNWVRVKPDKISRSELEQVLGLLGTISGFGLQTRLDKNVEGAVQVRAIPEDVKARLAGEKSWSEFTESIDLEKELREILRGFT